MACDPVADGEVAAVVTFLEMSEPPKEPVPRSAFSLQRVDCPEPEQYRELFRLVGAHWLWFSRLIMPDSKLGAILGDPGVELYVVRDGGGRDVGMVELDLREAAQCELAFIGLVPELTGVGHGRWLVAEALRRAWREDVSRVLVHTCSLDHPAALPAYLRAGFVAVKRKIERFPDPRLIGILPPDCAPQVPVLGTVTSSDSRPDS